MRNKMANFDIDRFECEAIAEWDEKTAYAISAEINAIVEVNLQTGECKYCTMFLDEINKKRLYTVAIKCENKIYFVPYSGKCVGVYLPQTNVAYGIEIYKYTTSYHRYIKNNCKFSSGFVYGKYIYLLPSTYPYIIKIDPVDDTVEYLDFGGINEEFLFKKSFVINDNNVYACSSINSKILVFDLIKNEGRLISIPTESKGWWSMISLGCNYLLAPQNPGKILEWNPCENVIVKEYSYPAGFDGGDFLFTQVFKSNNRICFLPAKANMGVIIEYGTEETREQTTAWNTSLFENKSIISFMFCLNNYIYIRKENSDGINHYRINMNDLSEEEFSLRLTEGKNQFVNDYFSGDFNMKCYINENKYCGLKEFMNHFLLTEDNTNEGD